MGIIAKQSIRGTIVTYLGVAVGFVTTFFVLTRFLTSEEIGLSRVLIDAATLFVGLAQLGTSSSIIRFYPYFQDEKSKDHGFFFWTMIVPLVGFLLFALVYWACHVPLGQWFGEKSPLFVNYYYFVLPLAFFLLYQTVFETSANVKMRIVVPRTVRELITRIGMLVVYLMYAFDYLSMDGFVIAICCVYAFAAACNIVYLFSLGGISLRVDWNYLRSNRRLVRQYILYTAFLIVSAVTSILAPSLSSFFVTAKMGLEYTGIYAIATYIAVMVSIPFRSMTAIASPQLSRAIKENDQEQTSHLLQQVSSTLLLVGGFILLTIWLNIDLIFHILPNGDTYMVAKNVVLILGLGQLISATCTFALTALSYSRFYAFSLLLSLLLTALSLVLNIYLLPRFGMEGAAWSTLISLACYYIAAIVLLRITNHYRMFNLNFLKALLLLVVIAGLDYMAETYLMAGWNIWLSSIVRSVLFIGGGLWIAWLAQLSPEINQQIQTYIEKFKRVK